MTTPVPRFRRQVPVGRGGCHKRLERSQVRTAIIDAVKEPFKLEHGDIVIGESLAIIWAIVALAEALGMSTTAEGVESLDQVAQVARRRLHTDSSMRILTAAPVFRNSRFVRAKAARGREQPAETEPLHALAG